jgi:aspartate ammonia-lyase
VDKVLHNKPEAARKIFAQVAKVMFHRLKYAGYGYKDPAICSGLRGGERTEHDLLRECNVPADVYSGIQTLRAVENFDITGISLCYFPNLIKAIAMVKQAAARANQKLGDLEPDIAGAIAQACDEIMAGNLHNQFVVDMIQGEAGTSTNMNANEVIANRTLEIMGHNRGEYPYIHPNNHLLQDAVPVTLGQEFETYRTTAKEDMQRIHDLVRLFQEINLGATAIGTGITAKPEYSSLVVEELSRISGIDFEVAQDLVEATSDMGAFVMFSSVLKRVAVKVSKMCNDFRLLSSGPRAGLNEINLPPMAPGSSIYCLQGLADRAGGHGPGT